MLWRVTSGPMLADKSFYPCDRDVKRFKAAIKLGLNYKVVQLEIEWNVVNATRVLNCSWAARDCLKLSLPVIHPRLCDPPEEEIIVYLEDCFFFHRAAAAKKLPATIFTIISVGWQRGEVSWVIGVSKATRIRVTRDAKCLPNDYYRIYLSVLLKQCCWKHLGIQFLDEWLSAERSIAVNLCGLWVIEDLVW